MAEVFIHMYTEARYATDCAIMAPVNTLRLGLDLEVRCECIKKFKFGAMEAKPSMEIIIRRFDLKL